MKDYGPGKAQDGRAPLTEDYLREHTVGELRPSPGPIRIVEYDPEWPGRFELIANEIRSALGDNALRIEHVGSTAVPGLPAKPVIDVLLVVADSAKELEYVPLLESCGYVLRIREPEWHEHRLLNGFENKVNLHVFSDGCGEIDRMLCFRDRLRGNSVDRELYARTKRALAEQEWKYTQNYADAKTGVIEQILSGIEDTSRIEDTEMWPGDLR